MHDPKHLALVMSQDAIFDGEPDFMDASLVISVLNHKALGGTRKDLQEIQANPEDYSIRHGAKRYEVTVVVYAKPYDS